MHEKRKDAHKNDSAHELHRAGVQIKRGIDDARYAPSRSNVIWRHDHKTSANKSCRKVTVRTSRHGVRSTVRPHDERTRAQKNFCVTSRIVCWFVQDGIATTVRCEVDDLVPQANKR